MANLEANKQIARAFLKAIADGDLDAVEALLHPEAKWWIIGVGDLDRPSLVEGLKMLIAADPRTLDVTGILAEGDQVAVEMTGEMVYPGRVYQNQYHNLFRIQDGQSIHGKEYLNTQAPAAFMAG